MSVDLLRNAVDCIREDYGAGWCRDLPLTPFYLAVADWLESEAWAIEYDTGLGITEAESFSGYGKRALKVAHTYLREQP